MLAILHIVPKILQAHSVALVPPPLLHATASKANAAFAGLIQNHIICELLLLSQNLHMQQSGEGTG